MLRLEGLSEIVAGSGIRTSHSFGHIRVGWTFAGGGLKMRSKMLRTQCALNARPSTKFSRSTSHRSEHGDGTPELNGGND
jgi:hypothetical protein